MYIVFTFTPSGWARTVRRNTREYWTILGQVGFENSGFMGTWDECEAEANRINSDLPVNEGHEQKTSLEEVGI